MSASSGRPALILARRRRERPAASPAWLTELLQGLVRSGQVSDAVALVGDGERTLMRAAAGDVACRRAVSPLFDLASLTKPWTASLALRLDARGLLPLGLEIGQLWPGCDERLGRRTLEDLLRHRSGLLPWAPLYRRCRKRSAVARLLLGGGLLGARRGTYSDLDYVLWGLSAERALGRPLAELWRLHLLGPLGLDRRPPPAAGRRWLPCRVDNGRETRLAAAQGVRVARLAPPRPGHVQDGNARFLGAPAGHAGLFATAGAVLALARAWLRPGELWPAAAVEAALAGPRPWALGWRRATRSRSGGLALGAAAYGHVGFTGGSVWLDPARDRALVLLAHRTGDGVDLTAARRRLHAAALEVD